MNDDTATFVLVPVTRLVDGEWRTSSRIVELSPKQDEPVVEEFDAADKENGV